MKRFSLVFVSIFVFSITSLYAQTLSSESPKINWLTLEQAFQAIQKEPRKILVDVYTGWCGWCKVMDQKTFNDPKVIAYVNEKYYAVKLDAEQREDIAIGDKKYIWQNGYNQAGVALLQNKMSFPTIVYLDEKFNMIQPVPGYQDAPNFHKIIVYFGDNYFKKGEWEKFQKDVYPSLYGMASH